MKNIISLLFISIFLLSSCFWWKSWEIEKVDNNTKYENLPIEKQEEITTKVLEKISNKIEKIDMSDYSSWDLTDEKVYKLKEEMDKIVSDSVKEIKKEEWDFDSTSLEERLKSEKLMEINKN